MCVTTELILNTITSDLANRNSIVNTKRWLLDSGANSHICNDEYLFATYKIKKKCFSVPGGKSQSIGVGTINLKIHNSITNQYDIVVLTEVSHIKGSPNLIATGKLNNINLHVDTVKGYLIHSDSTKHSYKIWVSTDGLLVLPCITGFKLSSQQNSESSETDHLLSRQNLNKGSLNHSTQFSESEYHSDIKLNPELFKKMNEKFGPFETELFSSDTNCQLENHITEKQNSFLTEWVKSFFYGNPKFLNDFIYKTLEKAVNDFRSSPDLTKFVFVLPKWETSPWYKTFVDHFQIVEEIPKGTTRVFTVPLRPHFTATKTET